MQKGLKVILLIIRLVVVVGLVRNLLAMCSEIALLPVLFGRFPLSLFLCLIGCTMVLVLTLVYQLVAWGWNALEILYITLWWIWCWWNFMIFQQVSNGVCIAEKLHSLVYYLRCNKIFGWRGPIWLVSIDRLLSLFLGNLQLAIRSSLTMMAILCHGHKVGICQTMQLDVNLVS